ncbi:hypothetical protein EJ02DRAFT_227216 [Clathrospora elynae]|uniref:Uncharacterized protein n=1 Tax=Clathrospora elynae TaxID=706981 RepID=A0A6A5SKE8_9PLEO|nr:hypothetical protein EJ02DRAFT_227216 [Clathrospora elynae]
MTPHCPTIATHFHPFFPLLIPEMIYNIQAATPNAAATTPLTSPAPMVGAAALLIDDMEEDDEAKIDSLAVFVFDSLADVDVEEERAPELEAVAEEAGGALRMIVSLVCLKMRNWKWKGGEGGRTMIQPERQRGQRGRRGKWLRDALWCLVSSWFGIELVWYRAGLVSM